MTSLIEAPKQQIIFSDYHEEIEKIFSNRKLKIPTIPSDLSEDIVIDYCIIEISCARQYYDYLSQEIAFWKNNDPQNKLNTFSRLSSLNSALSSFNDAIKHSKTNNQNTLTNIRNSLNASINTMSNGSLYSQSQLTNFILKFKDKNPDFLSGVKLYFQKNRSPNLPTKLDILDGYYAAMEYSKILETYKDASKTSLENFKNNLELASENYSALNESYTSAFREQEERLLEIQSQTNIHFANFEKSKNDFFDSANKKISELEHLYTEKLKLSQPAKYWDDIEKDYKFKGTKWLLISCGLSILIVAGLICMILFVPKLFSEELHWIDNLKNSIILTIITSIAIYMLKLCVKMSMTSYHLSRDAKERSNLSYFYLALIENSAVSDNERGLILNALFSRSDTGLLKGDSSPSMPSNISDLVNIIGKVNDTNKTS